MLDKFRDIVTSGVALDTLKEALSPGAAIEKAHELLRDFNETLPTLKALGLSVTDMSFRMGIPPEIAASLVGSIETLDGAALKGVRAKHKDNQVVTLMLEALILASSFKSQLHGLGFAGIRMDVRLGLLPSVQISLLTQAASSQSILAA